MSTPPKHTRLARVALLLLAILPVSTGCGVSTAAISPLPTLTPPATYTPYPVPALAPAPSPTAAPEWVTHTVQLADAAASRTYKIDMPGGLDFGYASGQSGHSVVGFHYVGDLSADKTVADEMDIDIDASVVTDSTLNCRTGTKITVGPGITGYQADSANDTCDGSEPPDARVFWIVNCVCFDMMARVSYSGPQDFNTRYGAIWQRILASFVPPTPPASGDTTCS